MTAAPLAELLHAEPLPAVDGDKQDRGTAVIVAGSPSCPGAAVLTATAALRAGAGRVQITTHPSVAVAVAVAVPEALVIGWDLRGPLPDELSELLADASAVLIGPGLGDDAPTAAIEVARRLPATAPLVLDALALPAAASLAEHHLVVVPNTSEAEELARILGVGEGLDAGALGEALAKALDATVAVRGEETVVAGEGTWRTSGHPGLGTAGSGDVLVGVLVGLLARGIPDDVAAGWAVAAHAKAGELLGRGRRNPGYLARELLDALPAAFDQLGTDHRC